MPNFQWWEVGTKIMKLERVGEGSAITKLQLISSSWSHGHLLETQWILGQLTSELFKWVAMH